MNRRSFLKIAGLTATSALMSPTATLAATTGWVDNWWKEEDEADGQQLPDMVKPAGAERLGQYCQGTLRLRSSIHGEAYEFRFRDTAGNYDQQVLASLHWFLRCRDGSWQHMDVRAIESLNYLSALLGVPEIQINSAYRSPSYNAKLSRGNENVARNSLHMYGRALDINIPGIPIREICSYALYARDTIGYGGIGYYPKANFVHMDSGPVKNWVK